MKKIVTGLFLLIWSAQPLYAGKIRGEMSDIIKSLTLYDSIEIISYNGDRYIVSVADVEAKGENPEAKINARKTAEMIAESNLSSFINGEKVEIQEKLTTVRQISSDGGSARVIEDSEVYDEFVRNKSHGSLRNIDYVRWKDNGVYFHAAVVKIGSKPGNE